MHNKATHRCVSCNLCSLGTYILIAASDAQAHAFTISVATAANVYAQGQYRHTKNSIIRPDPTERHWLQCIKMNLIACKMVY